MSYNKNFEHEGEKLSVQVTPTGEGTYRVQVGDRSHQVNATVLPDGRVRFVMDGTSHTATTGRVDKTGLHLRLNGYTEHLVFHSGGHGTGAHGEASGTIEAPMTGTVLKVLVEEGQEVTTGDTVLILSAMKMEHSLQAAVDGVVSHVGAQEGDIVDQGVVLLQIDSAEPPKD